MKVDVTKSQLTAILNMTDDISAMIGCGDKDSDDKWRKNVKAVDRMLKKNGIKRKFK